MYGGGGGGLFFFSLFFLPKLKVDQNRNGRSKNIREYQEHEGRTGGWGGGGSKTEGRPKS